MASRGMDAPGCFYQLRQLRIVARSLSTGAAATIVHSFVTNRFDYCLFLYSGLPSERQGLPWTYSAFCGTPYWPNTKVRSASRLHVEGSALAPCPTAHRVPGCLLCVAVPVRHCSNLPYWSLSICVGYCEWLLPTLCGKGVLSVPFARTTVMQPRAFYFIGPSVWNGRPLELRLLSRTPSGRFYCLLRTVLFDRAGVGSASE